MSSPLAYRTDSDDEFQIRLVGPGPSTASGREERASPAWLARTLRALQELRFLEPNWNNRGASAPDETAILLSLELLHGAASHATPPDVVPTVGGGIQLEWHRCMMDVELEVSPQRRVSLYWHERDTGREWEGPLVMRRPRELAEVIGELICPAGALARIPRSVPFRAGGAAGSWLRWWLRYSEPTARE
jgi:hypothetical protein